MLKMVFMKYLQLPGQINLKIKIALKFMFDISSIPILTTRSDKIFFLNIYHMLCQNWSQSVNFDYKMESNL